MDTHTRKYEPNTHSVPYICVTLPVPRLFVQPNLKLTFCLYADQIENGEFCD